MNGMEASRLVPVDKRNLWLMGPPSPQTNQREEPDRDEAIAGLGRKTASVSAAIRKYVSVKDAAIHFGCSEDAIRHIYIRDPHSYKGVIYMGGYRCCLEDMELAGYEELVRRNDSASPPHHTPDTMGTASEDLRIPRAW